MSTVINTEKPKNIEQLVHMQIERYAKCDVVELLKTAMDAIDEENVDVDLVISKHDD